MIGRLAALIIALSASPAAARVGIPTMIYSQNIARYIEKTAAYSADFTAGTLPGTVTFARASTAWYFNSIGNLTSAGSNVARFDYDPATHVLKGFLIEEARTNKALQNRDLTQSAWAKTAATAALDQTGLDGSANTASSLTATGANATALQTVTQAAANTTFSVWLKCVTCTGAVQLTQDNGATYTTVSPTTSWVRYTLAAQSTLNPAFGVRLANGGDKIAWDGAQFEAGAYATSTILTTTAPVTRAVDLATVTSIPWFGASNGSLVVESTPLVGADASALIMGEFDDTTANNKISLLRSSTDGAREQISAAGSSISDTTTTNTPWVGNSIIRGGMNYTTTLANVWCNGGPTASFGYATFPAGISIFRIGNNNAGTSLSAGWVRKVFYWNTALTTPQMKIVTSIQ